MTRAQVVMWAVLLTLAVNAQVTKKAVAPGLTLYQRISSNPPLAAHWLVADPRAGARLEVELGQDRVISDDAAKGRETVSATAYRHRAVAAINGDFFPYTGDPLGYCVRDGEIVSEPARERAAIGWAPEGRVVIGIPKWESVVVAPTGESYPLGGVNRDATKDELVLLTPAYGRKLVSSTPFDAAVLNALSRPPAAGFTSSGVVSAMSFDIMEVAVPSSGAVLIGNGKASEFLKLYAMRLGARLKFRMVVNGPEWRSCTEAMGGGPSIVKRGKSLVTAGAENFKSSFSTTRHPRTAVGVTADGRMILMAVDGRQKISRGASLEELAQLMIDAGAVDAINLDGGGSTAMIVRGAVVNSPSDGAERPVADSVLVYANEWRPAPKDSFAITPADAVLKIGDTTRFSVVNERTGQKLDASKVVFGSAVGAGFMDQLGAFRALRAGNSSVSAWVSGILLRANVYVEDPNAKPAPPSEPPANSPPQVPATAP